MGGAIAAIGNRGVGVGRVVELQGLSGGVGSRQVVTLNLHSAMQ